MTHPNPPRVVFFDSTVFIGDNFAVRGPRLSEVRRRCNTGHVELLITDIVVREVSARLEVAVADAEQAIGRARDKARVLRNVPAHAALFEPFDAAAVLSDLRQALDEFITETKANVLPATEQEPAPIFDAYFCRRPPFGQGKKKSEFPDAFNVAALKTWAHEHNESVHVVSSDPDLAAACDSNALLHVPTLAALLELLVGDDEMVQLAHDRLAADVELVRSTLAGVLAGYWLFLDDVEGEATFGTVTDLEMRDVAVVSVNGTEVGVVGAATVQYSVDVDYWDPDTASYDSEDHQYFYRDRIGETLQREADVPFELTLRIDKSNPAAWVIVDMVVNNGDPLTMSAREHDER